MLIIILSSLEGKIHKDCHYLITLIFTSSTSSPTLLNLSPFLLFSKSISIYFLFFCKEDWWKRLKKIKFTIVEVGTAGHVTRKAAGFTLKARRLLFLSHNRRVTLSSVMRVAWGWSESVPGLHSGRGWAFLVSSVLNIETQSQLFYIWLKINKLKKCLFYLLI